MRHLMLALGFLTIAASAQAQVVITDPATQGQFSWGAPTTGGSPDRYELDLGGGFTSVGLVTTLKLDPQTPNGSYTASIRACLATAVPQCGPVATVAYSVNRPAPTPGLPTNFRIEVTISSGQVANTRIVPLP
jgi:hypothetical protein